MVQYGQYVLEKITTLSLTIDSFTKFSAISDAGRDELKIPPI